jgi:hypothetical protein
MFAAPLSCFAVPRSCFAVPRSCFSAPRSCRDGACPVSVGRSSEFVFGYRNSGFATRALLDLPKREPGAGRRAFTSCGKTHVSYQGIALERNHRCRIPLVWGQPPSAVQAERSSASACGHSNSGFAVAIPQALRNQSPLLGLRVEYGRFHPPPAPSMALAHSAPTPVA